MGTPQCETCAPGYTLVGGTAPSYFGCAPTQPPTPAPQTPGFAPVAPPRPPAGYNSCRAGRVFDYRVGKCFDAPPPKFCGPMVGDGVCPPPCVAQVVCKTKNLPCTGKTTICVAPPPTSPPPRLINRPAPVVTVPRVTRPLPGVPGGEIVEGGEAPPA